MRIQIINSNDESYAKNKLNTYYSEGLLPAEKKNYLTSLKHSTGPWMGIESASKDEPHYLLDAASQIATLGLGFNSSAFMGVSHMLEAWTNDSTSDDFKRLDLAFHELIKRQIKWHGPGDEVFLTYVNSGAEANEVALGACFANRSNPKANKVLAFEGSFHGRMMVTLSATWNKQKREPFEWPGYDTVYCPFPEISTGEIQQEMPQNWKTLWGQASQDHFIPEFEGHLKESLTNEIACLMKVREELRTGKIYAIIVEPMQCEGGDRFGHDRFFTALMLMAQSFQVKFIFDEVQTGFHLGREFFWHTQFELTDASNRPLRPDYVVCAKKAQVGLVISHHELCFRPEFQVASVLRGYIHAMSLIQSKHKILELEKGALKRLLKLKKNFDDKIENPRVLGLSFAFDLPDAASCNAFVAKRFERGLMYYPAGDKTLRFRLNTAFNESDLDFLFQGLSELCDEIFANKKHPSPDSYTTAERKIEELYSWHEYIMDLQLATLLGTPILKENVIKEVTKLMGLKEEGAQLIVVDKNNFEQYRQQIQNLQKRIYEPARQTADDLFERTSKDNQGLALLIEKSQQAMAIAFSAPLKNYPLESAVRSDPFFHDPKTLYMLDVTVDEEFHKKGLGRNLKYALTCLALARNIERINGKNRDQLARQMLNINLSLGSIELFYRKEHYLDHEFSRDMIYYTTPIRWKNPPLSLSDSINVPVRPLSLTSEYLKEQLPYINNKVCLSNFVSERFLNQFKAIMGQAPSELRSGYSASGQSECFDKVVKSIWASGQKKTRLLSFEGHYFGEGSNLSRSLSFKKAAGFETYFDSHLLPHPDEKNSKEVLLLLAKEIQENPPLAIFIEPLTQKRMREVPRSFLKEMLILARTHNTPVVYNETASAKFHYDNNAYFASNIADMAPDGFMCFLGGQAGIVGLNKKYFLDKPLMMISTWDGDEFSFAHYYYSMQMVLKNHTNLLATKEKFENKIKSLLSPYSQVEMNLKNGRGTLSGPLPRQLAQFFKTKNNPFIIHPSFDAMTEFLNLMKAEHL